MTDGEDYTKVLTEINRKAQCVADALDRAGRSGLPTQQVFCLLGARTATGAATLVGNCHVATLPQVVKLMRTGLSRLSPADVGILGLTLGERFRRPRRF